MNQHQVENFLNIIKYAIHENSESELPKLHEPVDWEGLCKLATAHNLFALFHEVACKYPEYKQRPDYSMNMQRALVMVATQIKKTETFLRLYRAFLEEDLHPIVMKGIICRQLYGKYGEHRPSGDEDILIKVEDFPKVRKVMEEQGYVCEFDELTEAQFGQMQHVTFCKEKSQFVVEVHANLMGHRNDIRSRMSNCFTSVFEDCVVENIKNVPITIMSHSQHFLFLVLHAFRHFTEEGVGIRQMLDILLYQEYYDNEIDWEILSHMLKENCVHKYLGDMQYIGIRYLGFNLKTYMAISCPDILLDDIVTSGVFGQKERVNMVAANITMEALNYKGKGLYAWFRAGFPSRKFMMEVAPYLKEKPWMLPMEWVKRWGRFLKKAEKYDGNLMIDSIKKSQKRMKLLKKYGL